MVASTTPIDDNKEITFDRFLLLLRYIFFSRFLYTLRLQGFSFIIRPMLFIPCLFSCLYFCVPKENQINLFALSSEIFFGLRSECLRVDVQMKMLVFAIIESYMVVFDLLILCGCVPFLLFASVLFWFISLFVQLQLRHCENMSFSVRR